MKTKQFNDFSINFFFRPIKLIDYFSATIYLLFVFYLTKHCLANNTLFYFSPIIISVRNEIAHVVTGCHFRYFHAVWMLLPVFCFDNFLTFDLFETATTCSLSDKFNKKKNQMSLVTFIVFCSFRLYYCLAEKISKKKVISLKRFLMRANVSVSFSFFRCVCVCVLKCECV